MFKNLWYKLFGHPTVDAAMADFQKIHDKLKHVVDVHGTIATEQALIVSKATAIGVLAQSEVIKARAKITKILEWL